MNEQITTTAFIFVPECFYGRQIMQGISSGGGGEACWILLLKDLHSNGIEFPVISYMWNGRTPSWMILFNWKIGRGKMHYTATKLKKPYSWISR